ncbi:MAG: 4-hydroxyphenylacetate 3-hydroxylase [Deltaproteobacteria bacterium]|nr:4-hydroxyphenylacetate 3-hydroxylase [Deltaproteobacteria bacterium]
MAVKTREEYLAALKKMRPNIYKFGELIEDVTTHPATKRTVESHARAFDAANDPELQKMYTTTSIFTGEKIQRWNSMMQDDSALIQNMRFKRQNYRRTGTCTGAVCVGWNAMNVMWAVTEDMDAEYGTNYKERLKKWILHAEKEGLTVAGALTDAKGDRSKSPSQQAEPDTNLHVKEVREDGIVIRGAKLMICGTAAAQEIFLLPGSGYKDPDKDYVLACVVPRDIEGLTIVEARHPSDKRELEDTADVEVPSTGITQGWLLFDDVFVPNERVFMCGEAKYSGKAIQYFTANYRACIGGCVTGQGDVMIGASILMARANGLKTKTFMNKLVDMSINNTVTFGLGAGACALGFQHASGSFFGGIVETGCMPSYADVSHPEYGPFLKKCIKAGDCSAETRFKAARLSEWLTIGAGVPGCMHGGGSPDGAKLVVRFTTPMEEYADYARNIINIEEEVKDPGNK